MAMTNDRNQASFFPSCVIWLLLGFWVASVARQLLWRWARPAATPAAHSGPAAEETAREPKLSVEALQQAEIEAKALIAKLCRQPGRSHAQFASRPVTALP